MSRVPTASALISTFVRDIPHSLPILLHAFIGQRWPPSVIACCRTAPGRPRAPRELPRAAPTSLKVPVMPVRRPGPVRNAAGLGRADRSPRRTGPRPSRTLWPERETEPGLERGQQLADRAGADLGAWCWLLLCCFNRYARRVPRPLLTPLFTLPVCCHLMWGSPGPLSLRQDLGKACLGGAASWPRCRGALPERNAAAVSGRAPPRPRPTVVVHMIPCWGSPQRAGGIGWLDRIRSPGSTAALIRPSRW